MKTPLLLCFALFFGSVSFADKLTNQCREILSTLKTDRIFDQEKFQQVLQTLDPDTSNVVMFAVKDQRLKAEVLKDFEALSKTFGVHVMSELTESERAGPGHRLFFFTAVGSTKDMRSFLNELKSFAQVNWVDPLVVNASQLANSYRQNLRSSKFQSDFKNLLELTTTHLSARFYLNLSAPAYKIVPYRIFETQLNQKPNDKVLNRAKVFLDLSQISMPYLSSNLEPVKLGKTHLVLNDEKGEPQFIVMREKDFDIFAQLHDEFEQRARGALASSDYIESIIKRSLKVAAEPTNLIRLADLKNSLALPDFPFAILKIRHPQGLVYQIDKIKNLAQVIEDYSTVFNEPLSIQAKRSLENLLSTQGIDDSRLLRVKASELTHLKIAELDQKLVLICDSEGRPVSILFPHVFDQPKPAIFKPKSIEGPGESMTLTQFREKNTQIQLSKSWGDGPQYFLIKKHDKNNYAFVMSLKAVQTSDLVLIEKLYFETFKVAMSEGVKQSVIQYQNIGKRAILTRYKLSPEGLDTQGPFAQVIGSDQHPLYFVFKAPASVRMLESATLFRKQFLNYKAASQDLFRHGELMTLFANVSANQKTLILKEFGPEAKDWVEFVKTHSPSRNQEQRNIAEELTEIAKKTYAQLQIPFPNQLEALKIFSSTAQLFIESKTLSDTPADLQALRVLAYENNKDFFDLVSRKTKERAKKFLEMGQTSNPETGDLRFLLQIIAQKICGPIQPKVVQEIAVPLKLTPEQVPAISEDPNNEFRLQLEAYIDLLDHKQKSLSERTVLDWYTEHIETSFYDFDDYQKDYNEAVTMWNEGDHSDVLKGLMDDFKLNRDQSQLMLKHDLEVLLNLIGRTLIGVENSTRVILQNLTEDRNLKNPFIDKLVEMYKAFAQERGLQFVAEVTTGRTRVFRLSGQLAYSLMVIESGIHKQIVEEKGKPFTREVQVNAVKMSETLTDFENKKSLTQLIGRRSVRIYNEDKKTQEAERFYDGQIDETRQLNLRQAVFKYLSSLLDKKTK